MKCSAMGSESGESAFLNHSKGVSGNGVKRSECSDNFLFSHKSEYGSGAGLPCTESKGAEYYGKTRADLSEDGVVHFLNGSKAFGSKP